MTGNCPMRSWRAPSKARSRWPANHRRAEATPSYGRLCLTAAERLEGDDGVGVLDARNHLHLFVHEVADIGALIDIEFDEKIEVARGRVDLRGDLGLRQRVGDDIGLAKLAFDLDEKGDHRCRLRGAYLDAI